MLYLLKRHPVAVRAFFRHSLVLTYALRPEALEPLLPEGLALDTWQGRGFLAIALVQTEGLRPGFLPASMGRDFFLSGYRIFTRLKNGPAGGAGAKRGLRILRSDTDSSRRLRETSVPSSRTSRAATCASLVISRASSRAFALILA